MLGLTTLKAKLIIGAIIVAIVGGLGFYIHTLNKNIDELKKDKIELSIKASSLQATIEENQRQKDNVDNITSIGDKERVIIEKHYQNKVTQIDKSIQEGKDKPVGPLLNDYFNNGL